MVIGSSGMLGKSVASLFRNEKQFHLTTLSRSAGVGQDDHYQCDLTEHRGLGLLVAAIRPDLVINCSGIVDLGLCEANRDYARQVHVESTRVICSNLLQEALYIHISTDSVFDGLKGDYSENDVPHPLNYYAESKLAGEIAAMTTHPNTIVLRCNMYGLHSSAKKSLAEWALSSISAGLPVTGFTNVWFNPLHTKQLSDIILALSKTDYRGILNAGCLEYISKYEFLRTVARAIPAVEGYQVLSGEYQPGAGVARPLNTTLNTTTLASVCSVPAFCDGIDLLLSEFKASYHETN